MKPIYVAMTCVWCLIWNPAWGVQTESADKGLQAQKTVSGMKNLTAELGDPLKVFEKKKIKPATGFDAAKYFTVLKNICLPKDKTLDYFFHQEPSAGYPVLYVRSEKQKPYNNMAEYSQSPDYSNQGREKMMDGIVKSLEVKDTEDGYFEYVVFYLMAPNFYLHKWAQADNEIICHATRLKEKFEYDTQMPAEVKAAANKLDLAPQVNLTPDKAEVKIVTFTAWGGFFEERFIVARSAPHVLLERTQKCLVEYNCGIKFK